MLEQEEEGGWVPLVTTGDPTQSRLEVTTLAYGFTRESTWNDFSSLVKRMVEESQESGSHTVESGLLLGASDVRQRLSIEDCISGVLDEYEATRSKRVYSVEERAKASRGVDQYDVGPEFGGVWSPSDRGPAGSLYSGGEAPGSDDPEDTSSF